MVAISTCLFIYHAKIPQASTISKSSKRCLNWREIWLLLSWRLREKGDWIEWLVQSKRRPRTACHIFYNKVGINTTTL